MMGYVVGMKRLNVLWIIWLQTTTGFLFDGQNTSLQMKTRIFTWVKNYFFAVDPIHVERARRKQEQMEVTAGNIKRPASYNLDPCNGPPQTPDQTYQLDSIAAAR